VPAKAVAGTEVKVSVTVTNTGKMAGDEVVQLYLTDEKATTPRPLRQLEGFDRITLRPGESRRVEFTLEPEQFSILNNKDIRVIEPGWFTVAVGGRQPVTKGGEKADTGIMTKRLQLTGREISVNE